VMPSRAEPFGLVALEALAAGAPVLATAAGGLAEVIDHAVGGLVPVDDPAALAEQVARALTEHWKTLKGPAARRRIAERHGPQQWVERIEAVYRAALDDRFGLDASP
jgi:D-inositol-3-phosphate glycosyltransferase